MIGSQQITRAQALAAQIGAEHSRLLGVMAMEAGNAGSGMHALNRHETSNGARVCMHPCMLAPAFAFGMFCRFADVN